MMEYDMVEVKFETLSEAYGLLWHLAETLGDERLREIAKEFEDNLRAFNLRQDGEG